MDRIELFNAGMTENLTWNRGEKLISVISNKEKYDDHAIVPCKVDEEELRDALQIALHRKYGRSAQLKGYEDISWMYFPREEEIERIITESMKRLSADIDVCEYAFNIATSLKPLLEGCDISWSDEEGQIDSSTDKLVQMYVVFPASIRAGIGGSASDYCWGNVRPAFKGLHLELRDDDAGHIIAREILQGIRAHAVYPEREIQELRDAHVPVEEYANKISSHVTLHTNWKFDEDTKSLFRQHHLCDTPRYVAVADDEVSICVDHEKLTCEPVIMKFDVDPTSKKVLSVHTSINSTEIDECVRCGDAPDRRTARNRFMLAWDDADRVAEELSELGEHWLQPLFDAEQSKDEEVR